MNSYKKLNLLLLILLTGLFQLAEGQIKKSFEFSQGFSFGTGKTTTGSDTKIPVLGIPMTEEIPYSLGSGNHSSFRMNFKHDSNAMVFFADLQFLFGKNTLTNRRVVDSLNTKAFQNRTAFQIVGVFGISYLVKITNRFKIAPSAGIMLPIVTRIRDQIGFESGNGNYTYAYYALKSTISPGIQSGLKFSYQISEKANLTTGMDFQFMNLRERKSKLSKMESNQFSNIEDVFPHVSDREINYHNELSDIQNDPVINPDGFDINKPSDRLAAPIPMSRIVWWFGMTYQF